MISIVSPIFNSGHYLQEMLESVRAQGDCEFEHIIMDGGSTDGSLNLLRQYAAAYPNVKLISEPDTGQSDALEKGFQLCSGEYVTWINGDDALLPGALLLLQAELDGDPSADIAFGAVQVTDANGMSLYTTKPRSVSYADVLLRGNSITQPGSLMRMKAFTAAGGLNRSLRYCMDYDLWLRLLAKGKARPIATPTAKFRLHFNSKTGSQQIQFHIEHIKVARKYGAPWFCANIRRSVSFIVKHPLRAIAVRLGLIDPYRAFLPKKS